MLRARVVTVCIVRVYARVQATTLAFDKLYGPTGELYSMRIMDAAGEKILSILLNYDIEGNDGKPGKYHAGAVEKWEELRKTYADINGDVKLLG
jgi:hypothetical protein